MVHSGIGVSKNLLCNVVWLLFALSFVWFPYIGMTTLPCRHKPVLEHKWTQLISANAPDYHETQPASECNQSVHIIIQVKYEQDGTNSGHQHKLSYTARVLDQQKRMAEFCSVRRLPKTVYDDTTLKDFYHHILVDDDRKLLFCYIPKVACSNWKRVFLILAGLVNPSEKLRPSVEVFRQVKSLENFTPLEQEYRLRNYFKFMFIRNPPERILSAYRNKIEHPMNNNPSEQSIWDEVRFSILSSYRQMDEKQKKNSDHVYPTFSEFIHFLHDSNPHVMNEHYKSMTDLCQPCALQYHYVGNFATLRRDTDAILGYLNINTSLFWDRGKHFSNPTQNLIQKYYSQLSTTDIQHMEETFADDFALYSYLFTSKNDGGYSEVASSIAAA